MSGRLERARVTQRWYCTYFDRAYATRGQVMVASLRAVGEHAPVIVVCFDDDSLTAVRKWDDPGVIALPVADLERRFPELAAVKKERTTAEYFFTSTPFVIQVALQHASEGQWVTYLDADLWFTSHPEPVFDELADGEIGLVRHDYLPSHKALERFGVFNVGWVSVRACEGGLRAAQWWGDRCLEWCADHVDGQHFADQGYLNDVPGLFPGVVEIGHPGANLAPWNINSRAITRRSDGQVEADGEPALFFHFHGVRQVRSGYLVGHAIYGTTPNRAVIDGLYRPYFTALTAASSTALADGATRGRGWRGIASRTRLRFFDMRAVWRGEVITIEDPGLRPGGDTDNVG